ncbi:MAG: hypothetical protein ACTHJ3_08905 [Pararhizobium sp.]
MATTMFFEKTIRDKEDKKASIEIEFGRSSYYDGESLMYFNIEGKSVIVDEKTGREIYEAMQSLAAYLGYDRG